MGFDHYSHELLARFFYLFGRYHHWPQRLLRLRGISLAERPYRNFRALDGHKQPGTQKECEKT